MSRNRTFFRDMRWEVICGNQRILGIRGNPNSWNQKREFSDTRGNLLFKMKKAKGKKRVGESKHGAVVFAVQRERDELNASWTVEFTNARDKRTVRWNVRGSATTNDVYVNVSTARAVPGLRVVELLLICCALVLRGTNWQDITT